MTNISSIHIQPTHIGEFFHNSREKPTKNSIYDLSKNFCNRKALESIEAYKKDLEEKLNLYYQEHRRKVPKNTKTLFSAIINLKEDSTIQDVEKVANYLKEKLCVKIFQVAIHEDEGHYENGKFIKNRHAHIVFSGLDKNARSIKRNKLHIRFLRQMQEDVAKILNMERGRNRAIGKRKRLDTYEYKKAQKITEQTIKQKNNEIEELKLTKKILENKISNIRKMMLNFNKQQNEEKEFTQEDYKALSEIKKLLRAKDLVEVKEKLEVFGNEIKIRIRQRQKKLLDKNVETKGLLFSKEEVIKKDIATKIVNITTSCKTENINIVKVLEENEKLKKENKQLKAREQNIRQKADYEIKNKDKEIQKLKQNNEKLLEIAAYERQLRITKERNKDLLEATKKVIVKDYNITMG